MVNSSRFHPNLQGCNILSLRFVTMLCILFITPKFVDSRGRMMEPVQRSSLWRRGFDALVNSDDDALNCGGKWRQQHDNKGKCGVCGDPYDIVLRDHEAGGKYASGIVSNRYTTNDTSILVVIDITNFLGGYFEFRICPHNSFKTPVQQTCLDRHQLKIEGNRYRYYPSRRGPHHLRVEIPKGMSCIQCVLQWKWHTGKDWGICPDGIGRIGCGPQEEYVNCADIAIDPATPQDLDLGLSAGFFGFPLNSVRKENILNPNSDVIIPAVKPPPGGIPLLMENIRNDVMVEPASFAMSGTLDTVANMIEPRKSISVFPDRSGDSGTAIQPKFEFFNGEHSTSIVPAMTDATNASTTPANTGAQKDDIVVLPFMGDNVNKEPITNSGSNGSRVSEIYTEVNGMKEGTNAEVTTMPYVKNVLLDMDISNISNLGPSLYSQLTDTRIDVTFSQKNDKGTSTMVIQSTTDDVHTTSQLYDITTPEAVSNTNIPTAAESITLDSDNTSLAGVGMDVSISTGMPPTSNASDARNDTGTLGSLASRQTRSILRIPDLSIEATTISLNQSFNLERTVQSQENIESSTVISSNLQSGTVSQNQAGNFSIMPGRLFGVPLVHDSGNQLITKMNDLSKSIQTDAGASQEVNISSLGASVQNRSTISGSLRGTSQFDKGTQTDLTSANGWFRNVDGTSAQAVQMTSSGQISQISSITADILNQPQTDPNETATGYESWVQPTTIFPTITSSEASTWNEQSNQSQSIRSRIMSMMGQSSSGSGSENDSTSSATFGGVTSERPITSSQAQLSKIQLQPIFDNLLQALQAKNFSLANTSQTSQRDTNIYEYLQAMQALLLEKILNQDIAIFQNWNTQGIHSSNVMSPGIGPDAWVQPNVEGSQRATLETTTERAPVLTENAPVSNQKAVFESAKENSSRAQNKIQEQTSNETSSNMVETNAVELQQQSNNVQQNKVVNRGNMKQGIIDSTIFQAENTITNDKDARQRHSQAQYINANALQSNEVTSLADSLGREAHTTQQTLRNKKEHNPTETVNVSATLQQDSQIVPGTSSISAHESQMQKNKTVQMDNATSIDLQYSMQPVNPGDFRKVSQGQTTAISDQQTSHTQPGNTVSVVSSILKLQDNVAVQTQKEVTVAKTETKLSNVTQEKTHENQPVTISITALDQRSASWSDQSDYIVSTEAYPLDTFKPEPSGADTWFLPDPVPLTTVPPPTLPKAQSTHWEQNTPAIINRENQGSQRRIYPRPDRLATMYLRNIFTQISPETNPLTIVVGLTPDMLMRAGVNPRIAESGNIGEIITALESVLGVSIRSRRSGAAVGPEGLDLGGSGSAPFDSLSILGGGVGAGTMSGMGPNDPVMGRDQQLMDGVGADMRGNGRFMNPVQRRRQQLRTEVMKRRQFMQEMRMLQDVMQLLGLGPEPLEPGDPGYRPPRGQGLGGQANPAAGLDPADVAPGAGGVGGALGGGMGMGRSRSQISQLNAVMEMIGL